MAWLPNEQMNVEQGSQKLEGKTRIAAELHARLSS